MTKVVTCAAPIAAALFQTGLKSLFKQAAIFSVTLLALINIGSPLRAAEAAHDPTGFDILGMKLGMSAAEIQAAIKAIQAATGAPAAPPLGQLAPTPGLLRPQAGAQTGLAAATPAQAAPDLAGFDILGMKLGMSVAEIQAAIKAYNPSLSINSYSYRTSDKLGGKYVEWVQVNRAQSGIQKEISAGFTVTQPSRAFYVGRSTQFPEGQQPLMDKTLQQLREKYGPESTLFGTGLIAVNWVFDKAAKQLSRTVFETVEYGDTRIPRFAPEYATHLVIFLQPSTNPHLLGQLSEKLTGDSIAVDDIQKLMAEVKAEQERQQQEQEQKASGVKAPL
jgi:hypothetical protein